MHHQEHDLIKRRGMRSLLNTANALMYLLQSLGVAPLCPFKNLFYRLNVFDLKNTQLENSERYSFLIPSHEKKKLENFG